MADDRKPKTENRKPTTLLRHPDFLRLWGGQTVSVFGSMITGTALPFTAILALDAEPWQVAVLAASNTLPGLLVGLHAGVWVDRLRRRPVMMLADIGRAALLFSVPLAWWMDALQIEQLYIVAFSVGVLTMFFDVAYQSYLPTLVTKDELVEGNSKLAATSSVSEFAGFSTAGWLVQAFTGPIAIFVDACTFVVSALFLRSIRATEPPPIPAAERTTVWREAVDGLRTVRAHPILRALAIATPLWAFGFGVFAATYMLYVTRELGFEPGVLGVIFGLGGLSSLAGAMLAARAAERMGLGMALVLGVGMMGLSMLFIPAAGLPLGVAAVFLIAQQLAGDGCFVVFDVNATSLRQTLAPERMLGRVNAFLRILELGSLLTGTLIGGLMGETIGLRAALTIAASMVVLAALWLFVSPARRLREVPEGSAELPYERAPDPAPYQP